MRTKIKKLLKKRKAILLAHNYQPAEIQDIADLCGDSLELSIKAAATDASTIVFCGVHFMAETASILSPEKTVLLPNLDAGCPMADMVTAKTLKSKIESLPPMPVVTYVNSPAEVKALSTACCTSANVVKVVNSFTEKEILMVPDKNLAQYAATKTDKKLQLWEGYCPIHNNLSIEDIKSAKKKHPDALFMAHPECSPEILEIADVIVSTSGMIRHAGQSKSKSFIIGTENGLIYPLKKANPDKIFYSASETMECADMKKISIDDVFNCLENMDCEVKVPEDIRINAVKAVKRMLDFTK